VKWPTHIVSSLFITLPWINPLSLPFLVCGSVLPDAIETMLGLKHRNKITHGIELYLILLASGAFFYSPMLMMLSFTALHHLFIDAMTLHGVYVLGRNIHGNLNTDSIIDNIAVFILHLFIALFLVK
jgi:hypothetical protein